MLIPIQTGWFDSDIQMNEAIRLEGDSLVHYFFETWQAAQEFATRNRCQSIQRVWSRQVIERFNWTRHWSGGATGCPKMISGTIKLDKRIQYW